MFLSPQGMTFYGLPPVEELWPRDLLISVYNFLHLLSVFCNFL